MKQRLDVFLVNQGYVESREKAKKMIMAGLVFVNHQREDKVGTPIAADSLIEIKADTNPYVSRGGLKLEKAIKQYGIDLTDKVCIDIGASTGGFTDCMLQNGAAKVYSVDVGYGQLHWKLRQDKRVVCLEKTNVRYLDSTQVPEQVDFISVDVSFISITKIMEAALGRLKPGGQIVCLIKPQFEAGRDKVGKNGVIKQPVVHQEVIEKIQRLFLNQGIEILGLDYSPIKGPKGNIEYLIYGRYRAEGERQLEPAETLLEERRFEVEDLIKQAHASL